MVANFTFILEQNNYGQRLQNYALQEFLMKEFGETMVTMDYDPSREGVNLDDGKFFHTFEREMMRIADIRSEGLGILSEFDHVIIGGDQVFNTDLKTPWNMLPYIANRLDKRRNVFSYAASVSWRHAVNRDFLSKIELQMIAYGLREDCYGIDYIKNIDPVFLLVDSWGDIARGEYSNGGTTKYIVDGGCMSELSRTDSDGKILFSAKNGDVAPDPRVFVGLFRGASRVVTNSFHGVCFALINRVSKIDIMNPEDHRIVNLKNILDVAMESGEILNYDEIHERIRKEVVKSRNFIERCLHSNITDYCAYSKARNTRDVSSSGGVVPELARQVTSRRGTVIGGAFSDDFRKVIPAHARTMYEYFERLSKSKYSFCALPDINELRKDLSTGAPVMYVGSPCHVKALRKLIGDVPSNLILVDFRCRGYSHPSKLSGFVDEIEHRYKSKVASMDFRPRHKCEVAVHLDNGKDVRFGNDVYNKFIFDTLPMCRNCPFAHGHGLSCADITVSDFWANSGDRHAYGKEFTPEAGCTLVSVNTEKGRMMWFDVSRSMEHMPLLLPSGRGGAQTPRKAEGPDYMVWTSYHDDSQIKGYHLVNDAHHTAFPVHKVAVMRNVNYMNPVWSELVTLWYVYSNRIRHDIVGFSHYRRQIKPSRLPGKGECAIFTEFGVTTPYLQYKASHSSVDMDEVLRILDRRYGTGNPYAIDIRNAAKVIGCNCFMMTWDDFVGLCDFLFPVLLEYSDAVGCGMDPELWRARTAKLFKEADVDKIRYQTRVVGFLAERLVSAYIHTHMFFYY